MNDGRSSPEGARWKVPDWSPEDQHRDQSYLDEVEKLRARVAELETQKSHREGNNEVEVEYKKLQEAYESSLRSLQVFSKRLSDIEEIPNYNKGDEFKKSQITRLESVSIGRKCEIGLRNYLTKIVVPVPVLFWKKPKLAHELNIYIKNNSTNAFVIGLEILSKIDVRKSDQNIVNEISSRRHVIHEKIGPNSTSSFMLKDSTNNYRTFDGEYFYMSVSVFSVTYYIPEVYELKNDHLDTSELEKAKNQYELEKKRDEYEDEWKEIVEDLEKDVFRRQKARRSKAIEKGFSYLHLDDELDDLLILLGKTRADRDYAMADIEKEFFGKTDRRP